MYWTGAPCRCVWPPPWPQACRKQAAACARRQAARWTLRRNCWPMPPTA
nr:MAG TPA: hypothetical protein [Caudoviricetes sp.]DAJ81593.1 MAG TPA: hypothetical protein [Caudoviricetes sp.]